MRGGNGTGTGERKGSGEWVEGAGTHAYMQYRDRAGLVSVRGTVDLRACASVCTCGEWFFFVLEDEREMEWGATGREEGSGSVLSDGISIYLIDPLPTLTITMEGSRKKKKKKKE